MKLVLDNNIFFSLMNPKSIASYVFFFIDEKIYAPEFINIEFEKYKELCLSKSKLSEHEFELRQKEIEKQIKFVKLSEYTPFIKQASNAIVDKNDVDFLALALKLNSVIWSNDVHLKQQQLVKVYTTKDLIESLLKFI